MICLDDQYQYNYHNESAYMFIWFDDHYDYN